MTAVATRSLSPELLNAGVRRDLTGRRFGRLFVLSFSHASRWHRHWVAACSCGSITTVTAGNIRSGHTKSCGCKKLEYIPTSRTHGGCGTNLYRIWTHMRERCENPKQKHYRSYGGRGIKVCREWHESFEAFRDWALANSYEHGLTIDRRDNDQGYSPSNCRWVPFLVNARNKSTTRRFAFRSSMMTIPEISELTSIPRTTLWGRISSGMTAEEAVSAKLYQNLSKRRNGG